MVNSQVLLGPCEPGEPGVPVTWPGRDATLAVTWELGLSQRRHLGPTGTDAGSLAPQKEAGDFTG